MTGTGNGSGYVVVARGNAGAAQLEGWFDQDDEVGIGIDGERFELRDGVG